MIAPVQFDQETLREVPRSGPEIEVSLLSVRLALWDNEILDGAVFLRKCAAGGREWETLGERLNAPATRFLPFMIGSRVELLQLEYVSHLEVSGRLPDIERREMVGAMPLQTELRLRSGVKFVGEFLEVLPPGRTRLSDLLNRQSDGFLLFRSGAVTRFINRDVIMRVRL